MKTSIAAFCILGIGLSIIFTKVKNKTIELMETTNTYISVHNQSIIENIEDHKTHNDIVISHGNVLCTKTLAIYRTK